MTSIQTNININNLRSFLSNVSPNQTKTTLPGYENKYALVNTVAITSSNMSINPKTGTISVTTSTGTILVPQPVINPILVNYPNSFIQTNDNKTTVTSKGEEDTIITNFLDVITNIDDVTNSGYTKNNSISNLYDSISSNFWNPQVNEGNADPYLYKLNYTFTGTNEIYKFAIKNNNSFPGFTNIRVYPTSNPSNYVDIQPATDTNNQYVNETVALLIDGNGAPLFNTNQMTAEFTLNPSLQPNTFYQYGQAYGVIYNTNTLGLRAGNYISANTGGTGNKLEWSYSYLENQNTLTGTNNTSNNYLVSTNGTYRIAQNKSFYQLSADGGVTYTKKTLEITSDMKSSSSGQYVLCFKYENGINQSKIYASSNYGDSFTTTFISNLIPNVRLYDLSTSGNTQCTVSDVYGSQLIYTYISTTYGSNFQQTSFNFTFGTNVNFINLFVSDNTDCKLILTLNGQFYIYYHTGPYNNPWTNNPVYSSRSPDVILVTETLSSIGQNYNSNPSVEGQYKTALGTIPSNQLAILYTTNSDYTYSSISDHTLFTEWYSVPGISINSSRVKISSDGSKQIIIIVFNSVTISLYKNGPNWSRSSYFPTYLNIISNVVSTDDFSLIQVYGGYYYSYNGQYRTDPISYVSSDYGNTWVLNSAINPASSFVYTNFYNINFQTNKTYFQIKDINQNQVLGVSDNGFNMTKDLRVNNSSAYILGGTLTVGPDEVSGLLNDYTLNIDGTLSARNIVLLSDERFKNVLGDVDNETSKNDINKINIVKYKFKDRPDDSREFIGIIAQELEKIISDVVDINKSTYQTENGSINIDNLYSINYTSLLSYLISAIQYNQERIKKLEELLETI